MILEAYNLKKTFLRDRPLYKQILLPFGKKQKIKALDSVSITIDAGQILGVIGSNGAGKTTLLKILADLLEPDEGIVKILGQSITKNRSKIRGKIGYVSSDERSFFWRLTGRENLEFFGKLYGLSYGQAKTRTVQLIKQFHFENQADQLFRDYSAGMRKKVSVMRAILHEPVILLLDEVTNSLDPNSAKMVKDMVRWYVSDRQYHAAIWSTHRLEEISQICDKIAIIDSGRIVSIGHVEDFLNNSATEYLLKIENLNGQFEALCKRIGYKAKAQIVKDNTHEFIISGMSQKQFSQIVSLAVKDFGACVIFAGCVKKEPRMIYEEIKHGEKTIGSCC